MDIDGGLTDFRWRPIKHGNYGWYAEDCSIGPNASEAHAMTTVLPTKAELIERMNGSFYDGYTRVK
jgi:hypothetical protein